MRRSTLEALCSKDTIKIATHSGGYDSDILVIELNEDEKQKLLSDISLCGGRLDALRDGEDREDVLFNFAIGMMARGLKKAGVQPSVSRLGACKSPTW